MKILLQYKLCADALPRARPHLLPAAEEVGEGGPSGSDIRLPGRPGRARTASGAEPGDGRADTRRKGGEEAGRRRRSEAAAAAAVVEAGEAGEGGEEEEKERRREGEGRGGGETGAEGAGGRRGGLGAGRRPGAARPLR